jgi:hypothetical protein
VVFAHNPLIEKTLGLTLFPNRRRPLVSATRRASVVVAPLAATTAAAWPCASAVGSPPLPRRLDMPSWKDGESSDEWLGVS